MAPKFQERRGTNRKSPKTCYQTSHQFTKHVIPKTITSSGITILGLDTEVIWSKYTNLFTESTRLDWACCQWHPCQHWQDIHTSWRKDIVTHSWDQISFHSELSIYGTVFQVRWYLLRQWIFSKKGWASIGKIAVFHWIQILLEDNKWSAKKPSWPNVKGWKQRWRWLKEVVPRCRFQWLKLKRHVPLCGGVVDSKLILVDRLLIFDTV